MQSHHSRNTDNGNDDCREQVSFLGDFLFPAAAITRVWTINSHFFIPFKSRHPNGRLSKCIRFPRNGRELPRRPIYPKFPAAASSIKRGRERQKTKTGFVGRCYATSKRHRKSPPHRRCLRSSVRVEWLWKGEWDRHTFQFFNFHVFSDYE